MGTGKAIVTNRVLDGTDRLVKPPAFFVVNFKTREASPFPVLYYQYLKKPFHIRALCRCRCCKSYVCEKVAEYGQYIGKYQTRFGYLSPNMYEGLELVTMPLKEYPGSVGKLYKRVVRIENVYELYDGRFFAHIHELGDFNGR